MADTFTRQIRLCRTVCKTGLLGMPWKIEKNNPVEYKSGDVHITGRGISSSEDNEGSRGNSNVIKIEKLDVMKP